MSLKKMHIVVLIFLFILALFVAHSSNPQSIVNAQNERNLQIHDVPFNLSSTQVIESPDVQIIHIPDPRYLEEYVLNDAQEQVLGVEGDLDKFVYLPIIDNNFVYIFDDFSDPNSGFPFIDTSTNTYQYINGEYQILNKTNSYLGVVALGYKLDEFEYEVSMRRVGSARGYYGIVFWLNDNWSEYYLLMISPDTSEYYFFNYQDSTGFTQRQYATCGDINPGNGINQIRMRQYWALDIADPGLYRELEFNINNCPIQLSFSPIPSLDNLYRVGFFAAPIDANHQVHFDDYLFKNYCVLYPSCSN